MYSSMPSTPSTETNAMNRVPPMPPDRRGVDVTSHGPVSNSGDHHGLATDYITFPLEAFDTPGASAFKNIESAFSTAFSVVSQGLELELDPGPQSPELTGWATSPQIPSLSSPTSSAYSWSGGSYSSPGGPPPSLSPTSFASMSEPSTSPISFSCSYSPEEYRAAAACPSRTTSQPGPAPIYISSPPAGYLPQHIPPDEHPDVTCDLRSLAMHLNGALASFNAPEAAARPDLQPSAVPVPVPLRIPRSRGTGRPVEATCPDCGQGMSFVYSESRYASIDLDYG